MSAVFYASLPPGVQPGQTVEVIAPDGQKVRFQVPSGLPPGQLVPVGYTPRQGGQSSASPPLRPPPQQYQQPAHKEAPPRQQSMQATRQNSLRRQSTMRKTNHSKADKLVAEKQKTAFGGWCNCCVCVPPDEYIAVERCGAFKGIRAGGCQFLGCDCAGRVLTVQKISARLQEHTLVAETKTKDNVFVELAVAVQLEVVKDRAYEAIYKLDNPVKQIESYIADVIRGTVPKMKLDHVFEAKDEIVNIVRERLTASMEEFGFRIHQVLVTELSPNSRVREAMNEIDANRRLRVAMIDRAEAEKIVKVKAAEAEAESLFLQGQGIARMRMAIVDGLKQAVGGEAGLDPKTVQELMLITQYFDMLETLSNGRKTTVFIPHSVGNLATIREEIRQGVLYRGTGGSGGPPRQIAMGEAAAAKDGTVAEDTDAEPPSFLKKLGSSMGIV